MRVKFLTNGPLWALFDAGFSSFEFNQTRIKAQRPSKQTQDSCRFSFGVVWRFGRLVVQTREVLVGLRSRGECSGVHWNPQHKGELRVTPSRARAERVILLCPVSWSGCFSRQVEDKRPCGHYRRTNPHPVQPRNEDQQACPAEDANPKSCLFPSTRHAGPDQAPAGHEQKRQDMVGKHSCPLSLNEK